jgi:betaine reductase
VCAITPVALMVGSNRIVPAQKIVNPLGNAELEANKECELRREIVGAALAALETEVTEPTILPSKA